DQTRAPVWSQVYGLTTDAASNSAAEAQMAADLKARAADNDTLLIQGVGTLLGVFTTTGGQQLDNEIQAIGGRADVLNGISVQTDANGASYALITANHTQDGTPVWGGAEASAPGTGGATLSALLTRDPKTNDYVVMQSDYSTPDANRYRFIPQLW